YGRMAVFLARIAAERPGGAVRGLGIDRKTALFVEPDGTARVITRPNHPFGRVSLFRMTAPPQVCEPGRALTVRGIAVVEFGRGDLLDLRSWCGEGGAAFRLSIEAGSPEMVRLPNLAV